MNFRFAVSRATWRRPPMCGLWLSLIAAAFLGCGQSTDEVAIAAQADAESKTIVPFSGLGDLPGGAIESHAWGVSADGKFVVGSSASERGDHEAFRWTKLGGMKGLGGLIDSKRDLGRIDSRADGVSDDGKIVVGNSLAGSTKAFRWTKADGMQDLGSLPSRYSSAFAKAISGDGSTIVGESMSERGGEAFRWTKDEGMKGIGRLGGGGESSGSAQSIALAISGDSTTIVGFSKSSNGTEAFRWTANQRMVALGDLPGGRFQSQATGVSGNGSIVVGSGYYSNKEEQAFKWTEKDGMTALDDLPGGHLYCTASAISRDGSTIVGAGYSDSGSEAVRWTDKLGVESIRQILVDRGVDMNGWKLWIATAVSADGQVIVGYGNHPAGNWEAWRADLSAIKAAK